MKPAKKNFNEKKRNIIVKTKRKEAAATLVKPNSKTAKTKTAVLRPHTAFRTTIVGCGRFGCEVAGILENDFPESDVVCIPMERLSEKPKKTVKARSAKSLMRKNYDIAIVVADPAETGFGMLKHTIISAGRKKKDDDHSLLLFLLPVFVESRRNKHTDSEHRDAERYAMLRGLRNSCDGVLATPTQPLFNKYSGETEYSADAMAKSVRTLLESFSRPSLIAVDFSHLRNFFMENRGISVLGFGASGSRERVKESLRSALSGYSSRLLYRGNVKNVILFAVVDHEFELGELNRMGELTASLLKPHSDVVWGVRIDPKSAGFIKVMVLWGE